MGVLLGYIVVEVELRGGSLASVVVVAILLYRLLNQALDLPASFQRLNQLTGAINFVESFTRDVAHAAERDGNTKISNIDGDIVFTNVSFRHGGRSILHDIDITIPRHQTIGIVGESGAGKTTFFHLFLILKIQKKE